MRRPTTSLAIGNMDHIPSIGDMFDAMNLDHPSPIMPQNRVRRPGAFTRSRSSSSQSPLHGFPGHSIPRQDMMWDRRCYGPGPSHAPFPSGRVEELSDHDLPHSMSADGVNYQDPHFAGNNYAKTATYSPDHRLSFEQAATSMYAALITANQECRSIEKGFVDDVRPVMRWLPPSYMDSLWIIRIGWDGSPIKDSTKPGGQNIRTENPTVSYESVIRRFTTAIQGMKTSAPPEKAPGSALVLSWEVLRTTMRKLQISLEAIEELLQLTRSRRDRMPLLLHELASAIHLLESVRDVWETSAPTSGSTSKGKSREMPTTNAREFSWAENGGCGNTSI